MSPRLPSFGRRHRDDSEFLSDVDDLFDDEPTRDHPIIDASTHSPESDVIGDDPAVGRVDLFDEDEFDDDVDHDDAFVEVREDRRRRGSGFGARLAAGSAFGSRVAIAIPGVILGVIVVVVGGGIFAAVVGLIAILAMYELYALTAAWRPLRWAGYVAVIVSILGAWGYSPGDRGVVLGVGVGLGCTALGGLLVARRDDITGRMATTAFGVLYIAIPFGLLVATRQLPHGGGAVANVLVGTWVFDTASFVGGKLWGSRRIAPFVSPGKTLEGLITGLVVGTAAVWVAGLYMDWISGWDSLILGVVICAAGFLGDLFESMLKRDIGVKDSGRVLLGHGGILDRFDALMFATVAAYFVTLALT